MLVPNRHGSSTAYRYGFNGKEKDDELKGEGNSYDFGARMLDPRIGRFFALDPFSRSFPDWSPYVYAFDNPIALIDENGEFGDDPRGKFYKTMGQSAIKAINAMDVNANKYKALYTLAQYRVENGFNLNSPGNNPFNLKGKGDAGQIELMTTEYIKGKPKKMVQKFAAFSSLEAGFEGYLKLLETNFPDASSALSNNSETISDFADGLMHGTKGVYATDPNYPNKMKDMLKGVIRDYEKDFNKQLEANNTEIAKQTGILGNKKATKDEKAKATSTIAKYKKSNDDINKELKTLKEFKKNEGITD
jgi:RHS repeat-associated protein